MEERHLQVELDDHLLSPIRDSSPIEVVIHQQQIPEISPIIKTDIVLQLSTGNVLPTASKNKRNSQSPIRTPRSTKGSGRHSRGACSNSSYGSYFTAREDQSTPSSGENSGSFKSGRTFMTTPRSSISPKVKGVETWHTNDSPLDLNFSYQKSGKRYGLPIAQDSQSSFSSSFSSGSDNGLRSPRAAFVKSVPPSEPNFQKFLPLKYPFPLQVPKLLLNKKDKKEWLEMQSVFIGDRQVNIRASRSEGCITGKSAAKRRSMNISSALRKIFVCGQKRNKNQDEFDTDIGVARKTSSAFFDNLPSLSDKRFDNYVNLNYIRISTQHTPNIHVVLHAELPVDLNVNLCHFKTDLAVSAMLHFFHPWSNVQCLWIPNLQGKILELLSDEQNIAKFSRLVYLRRFDAVLSLSEDAGVLLRHKNLCFLHCLTAALDIKRHRLLIIVKEKSYTSNLGLDDFH